MAMSAAEHLASRVPGRHPDLPETTAGTLRLDIREEGYTDHWYLTIADQSVEVSRSYEEADLVVSGQRGVFDRLAAGGTHIGSALLRNDVTVRGNLRLLLSLRRLFPGPPDAHHPRAYCLHGNGRR
ncbi:SCP2 sterol-binding domain-containing protein [Micromonospora mirobrigensis]|uniref:SCP-2 sterol transfer family protein n=1 Tax=Micromonospora mirobrigensis TaxID=262898 RepID=A0A1C4Z6G2_9ACTN|nr:SCP2 sterol-binding domain-containing protein [Micromonospora mirobrigensis]SCF28580.1 SCP-2 sterol transfer family protein [Micromonospora mirobrigensis]